MVPVAAECLSMTQGPLCGLTSQLLQEHPSVFPNVQLFRLGKPARLLLALTGPGMACVQTKRFTILEGFSFYYARGLFFFQLNIQVQVI